MECVCGKKQILAGMTDRKAKARAKADPLAGMTDRKQEEGAVLRCARTGEPNRGRLVGLRHVDAVYSDDVHRLLSGLQIKTELLAEGGCDLVGIGVDRE